MPPPLPNSTHRFVGRVGRGDSVWNPSRTSRNSSSVRVRAIPAWCASPRQSSAAEASEPVCEAAALPPLVRLAPEQHDHRFRATSPAQSAKEGAAVLDVLRVEADDARLGIGEEVLDQLGRADVRAVADRDEAAVAQSARPAAQEDIHAESAALRDHANRARLRAGAADEGDLAARGVHAQAVRADYPHAGAARRLEKRALEFTPLRDLAEAARSDLREAHRPARSGDQRRNLGRPDRDVGEIDRLADLCEGLDRRQPFHGRGARVDRHESAVVPEASGMTDELIAERHAAARRCSDHGHHARAKYGTEGLVRVLCVRAGPGGALLRGEHDARVAGYRAGRGDDERVDVQFRDLVRGLDEKSLVPADGEERFDDPLLVHRLAAAGAAQQGCAA